MITSKPLVYVFFFALLAGMLFYPAFIYTETSAPGPGHSGAPGEATCAASGCHTGSAENLDPSKLTIASIGTPSLSNGYVPGTVYNISVSMGSVQSQVKGFQLTVLDANGNGAGTLTITDINHTTKTNLGNRQYISHKNANTTSAWVFRWESPPTDIGPVTFYASGIGANGDNQATGDVVYRSKAGVSTTSGLIQYNLTALPPVPADIAGITIFPNPFRKEIFIEYPVTEEGSVQIELVSINGEKVASICCKAQLPGIHLQKLTVPSGIAAGLYMLQMQAGSQRFFKKLIAE
ncbi:MAG: hypothetical protein KatS3mg031_2230 [Chitinophagales bacterium]|nr:MAG: hypothetical protein KatS3mg031_2230 [Chitinophagales bacterium]